MRVIYSMNFTSLSVRGFVIPSQILASVKNHENVLFERIESVGFAKTRRNHNIGSMEVQQTASLKN
jgi:hypothetical protein